MVTINALGFIEVYGLVAGIEAADAMVKSAQVRLLRQYEVRPGMITLTVEGDLGACRAAVDAGVAAASRVGTVIASHVMGRPDPDTETLVLDLIPSPRPEDAGKQAQKAPAKADMAKPQPKAASGDKGAAVPDEVLAYIASAARGRSWKEIAKRFPELPPETVTRLDALANSGGLVKTGTRYRNEKME